MINLLRNIFNNAKKAIFGSPIHDLYHVPLKHGYLKNKEAIIGGKIFGNTPSNVERLFFHNDAGWYFCEKTHDSKGNVINEVTIHFEVYDKGILKICSLPGVENHFIQGAELKNFEKATAIYYEQVMKHVYGAKVSAADLVKSLNIVDSSKITA